jgi:hypothetical protein
MKSNALRNTDKTKGDDAKHSLTSVGKRLALKLPVN